MTIVVDNEGFLSAESLKLTEKQRSALVSVLDYLESGKAKLFKKNAEALPEEGASKYAIADFRGAFNMRWWIEGTQNCGTVCCLGGMACLLAGEDVFDITTSHTNSGLAALFYPRNEGIHHRRYLSITPEEAGKALRNYLTKGEARWKEVLDITS